MLVWRHRGMKLLERHESTVETGTSISSASFEVPPNSAMISETVITGSDTENRKDAQGLVSDCVIYAPDCFGHSGFVLRTAELLQLLTDRGVQNKDIAKAINVSPSRVTELFKGDRALKLDEAVSLIEQFDLEQPPSPKVPPLPGPISRLVVLYVAEELGAEADQHLVEELAEDVRAFAEYVADPKVRDSIDAAQAFFQAMRLRRPALAPANQQ